MATIDDKVVSMSFESSKFEQGVDRSISALDKLKKSLQFPDAGKGLDDLNTAANRVDLSHVSSALEGIKGKFSAMSIVAISALASITSKAVDSGLRIAKSLTLDPVLAGFHNYETQINAVQTILANTGLTGQKGLGQVNAALQDLNKYANQTVYNFSEMTKNIGTFTAAGVDLKTAAGSIKGIANLAALSGSNSQQASSAMYQLSQAIAAGTVHLQDWNSVVNAGMGGQVFQKALFNTAKAMGTITNVPVGQTFEEWKKAGNSFRQSLSTTNKAATDGTSAVAQAQKSAAKTVADAQASAAESVTNAAKSVKEAQAGVADAATSSAESVKNAQQGVSDAARQGAVDVAAAMQAQKDVIKQSAADVASALNGVRDARKRLAEAMKPPSQDELQAASDNLKTAQLDQADLADAVTQAQQDQTRAAQDLAAAQTKLVQLQTSGTATPDQILAAQRAVEDGQKRVTDSADAQERALLQQNAATRDVDAAEKDLQTTREKGTKKDQNVKDAQDALTVALTAYKDAQIKARKDISDADAKVAEARRKSVESQKKAGQSLVDAEKAQDKAMADSRQRLADAEQAQAKTIKDAQKSIADAHSQAADSIIKAQQSVAGTKGPTSWLTGDVLTQTLQQFTGDMTKAQLTAKGFTDQQAKFIQTQAKVAVGAATNIKTVTQLMEALKEEVATAWAAVFKTVFGDINQATKLFSAFHIAAENALTKPIYALNKLLEGWAKLGGRTVLIDALKQAFKDLAAVMQPIKDAFRDIFPATTAKNLFDATKRFKALMDALMPSAKTVDELKRTFKGLFALLDIGKTVLGDIFKFFVGLNPLFNGSAGGILNFTAGLGDFLVKVDNAVKKGGLLKGLLVAIGGATGLPLKLLNALKDAITALFSGFDGKASGGISKAVDSLTSSLEPLNKIVEKIKENWDKLINSFGGSDKVIKTVTDAIVTMFQNIVPAIGAAFSHMSFAGILAVIRTGLFAALVVMFKKFLGKGSILSQLGKGGFSEIFEGLTGSLKALQQNIKAKTLLEIAGAIALLAGALVALSFIDPKKLNNALAAMAIAFGELLGAMKVMEAIGNSGGIIKMPVIAGAMILLAAAIDILVPAVKAMSQLSWGELIKGLGAVAALLGAISLAAGPLSKNSAGMISAGVGMVVIAGAMKILASAVSDFGSMDLKTLAKGLSSVALAVVGIASASKLFPPGMVAIGAGLVLIGAGMKLLVDSVAAFGKMKLGNLAQGLGAVAAALVLIGGAMALMPPDLPLMAAGLVLVSAALQGIALAVKNMGSMTGEALIKGLLGLGGALTILAAALYEMQGTVAGSAALALAAVGLMAIAPALIILGKQSWESIVKGLISLAGALTILGVAGTLLAPVAPALLALGGALLVIGGGLALAGAGIALIGVGFSAIAVSAPAAIAILIQAILSFMEAIPKMVTSLVNGLLSMVQAFSDTAPKFVDALVSIANSLVAGIIKITPQIVTAFEALLGAALKVINDKAPDIIATGFNLLLNLLKGISDNIVQVTNRVGDIIIKFLGAFADKAGDIATGGFGVLVAFLKGIADHIQDVATKAGEIVTKFLAGIASRIGDIVKAGADIVINAINGIASKAPDIIAAGANLIVNILAGIAQKVDDVLKAAGELARRFINAFVREVVSLADSVATGIIDLLNGLADVIRQREWEVIDAMANVGAAIIEGLIQGLESNVEKVYKWLKDLAWKAVKAVADPLGIFSPSKAFHEIGQNIMDGLHEGLQANSDKPVKEVADTGVRMANAMKASILTPDVQRPVIKPVLDLTDVQAGVATAKEMMVSITPVAALAGGSIGQVTALQKEAQAASDAAFAAHGATGSSGGFYGGMQFVQNNYSPESLSDVEIYRQTQNQLSQVKGSIAPHL